MAGGVGAVLLLLLFARATEVRGFETAQGTHASSRSLLMKSKKNSNEGHVLEAQSKVDQELIALATSSEDDTTKGDVARLLSQGASPDACCAEDGNSALHEASKFAGNAIVAVALIEAGADVGAKNAHGHTPLHLAARYNEAKIAKLLMLAGAKVDSRDSEGQTPLHVAARWGSLPVTELLLKAGASVGARDTEGNTPLHEAAEGGAAEAARILIGWGAEVDARDARGQTPLHDSATFLIPLDVIDVLVQKGADVNAKDEKGETPLHDAAKKQRVEAVQYLLGVGADKEARDNEGRTPGDVICGLMCDGTEDQRLVDMLS